MALTTAVADGSDDWREWVGFLATSPLARETWETGAQTVGDVGERRVGMRPLSASWLVEWRWVVVEAAVSQIVVNLG